jgi:hypothetical protein
MSERMRCGGGPLHLPRARYTRIIVFALAAAIMAAGSVDYEAGTHCIVFRTRRKFGRLQAQTLLNDINVLPSARLSFFQVVEM